MKQSRNTSVRLRKTAALLMLPSVLLMGCAGTSEKCLISSQPLPTAPSLSTPLPPVDYSETARKNISEWQKQLNATQLMSEHYSTHGPKEATDGRI